MLAAGQPQRRGFWPMLAAVKLTSWPALSIAAVTACGRIDFGAHGDSGAAEGSVDCSVPADVTTGLVGWWKFDEASGVVAIDTAAGNDGLLLGGSSRVAGHLGGAVAFDGVTGLDGVEQPLEAASPYGTQANQSRIGAAEDARNFWSGVIDDVRIYDRALSGGEIGELDALTCDSPTPGAAAAWSALAKPAR